MLLLQSPVLVSLRSYKIINENAFSVGRKGKITNHILNRCFSKYTYTLSHQTKNLHIENQSIHTSRNVIKTQTNQMLFFTLPEKKLHSNI